MKALNINLILKTLDASVAKNIGAIKNNKNFINLIYKDNTKNEVGKNNNSQLDFHDKKDQLETDKKKSLDIANVAHAIPHGNYAIARQSVVEVRSQIKATEINEQKAFSTYKLAYADVLSHLDASAPQNITRNLKHQFSDNQVKINVAAPLTSMDKNQAIAAEVNLPIDEKLVVEDEKPDYKANYEYVFNLLEKNKITLIGYKDKTILVRDYFNEYDQATGSFLDDLRTKLNANKVIYNGEEK